MSKQECRLTQTPRSCSSPERAENPKSGSSRSSSSPIHWDAITGSVSKNVVDIRPSSWDNSDDELPLTLDNPKSHIYSSESQGSGKSVTAEIDELKKQFFESVITYDMDDLGERSELFLGSDRRQSPARVRRRSKSSSSSSTVMDTQNSPKPGDDLISHEMLFKHIDNLAPLLELNSKYYLDNFFAELRRKRISMLDSSAFDNERFDDDFQESLMEDEFGAFYTRTSRKLSQILEVEENKKDSDKDVEEYSENGDLFLKLSRKSERSNSSVETARNKILFESIRERKTPNIGSDISGKSKQTTPTGKDGTVGDEIISLTAKTAKIHLNTPRNNQEMIGNLNLPRSENPTPRRSSRRSSRSGSRKSTRDVALQSPKFTINLGKESGRSLKLEDVKTPQSTGKSSTAGSERSLKEYLNSRRSEPEPDKNIPDIRTPSLISGRSLELQDILLDQGLNSNRYGEASNRSEFSQKSPMGSEQSSKTSRTARSYRSLRLQSQRSELERAESRKSSVTPRGDVDNQINTPRVDSISRSRGDSRKSSLQEMQTKTRASSSSNVSIASRVNLDDFDNENVPDWAQQSSRSDVINTESFDKASQVDSVDDLGSARNSSRKLVPPELLDNAESIASSRSVKKSRPNSTASERTTLNIEKSDDVKSTGRSTDRIEKCESTTTQRSKNDSESDRRLSVINEVSYEDIPPESSKSTIARDGSNEKISENPLPSFRSVKNESGTNPKSEGMWNDLIETFSESQKQPFNWEDNFTSFLKRENGKNSDREASTPVEDDGFFNFENGEKDEDDFVTRQLTEIVTKKNEKVPSPGKRLERKGNLDLDCDYDSKDKMITDSDPQNLYFFKVEKTGNFGIGEFGDVTCYNLGTYEIPGDGKPKDHGDGIQSRYRIPTPILNSENWEKESKNQRNLWTNPKDVRTNSKAQKSHRTYDDSRQNDLKPSKSDNCIKTNENHFVRVDFSSQKLDGRGNEALVFENPGSRKRKAESPISSMKYSSSECGSDETDNQEFDCDRVRRAASLTDIAAELRRSAHEKSSEDLYDSRSELFERIRAETKDSNATNLNVFLARKKEDKTKSNWLTLKQKTSHRENKKSKSRSRNLRKDSKEYLSFRTKPSVPVLKLKDRNCFQNFYKRVISVFCLTPNSSLPTSK